MGCGRRPRVYAAAAPLVAAGGGEPPRRRGGKVTLHRKRRAGTWGWGLSCFRAAHTTADSIRRTSSPPSSFPGPLSFAAAAAAAASAGIAHALSAQAKKKAVNAAAGGGCPFAGAATTPPTGSGPAAAATEEQEKASVFAPAPTSESPPVVDPLLTRWLQLAGTGWLVSGHLGTTTPAMLATTVSALVAANTVLPKAVTQIAHPVVVAAAATAGALALNATAAGTDPDAAFHRYMHGGGLAGGAGDLVALLMNAAVSALGIRMFEARGVLEANWRPLLGGAGVSALASLFGTAWAAGRAELPPSLGLVLSQRSVMSALGIAGAELLDCSPNLAVASILLTGVYGASLGPVVLAALGLGSKKPKKKAKAAAPKATQGPRGGGGGGKPEGQEGGLAEEEEEEGGSSVAVTRGVAMGASAHAIGTAALMKDEPEAAAVSSVSLCVAGIVHTAVLSLPSAQRALKALVQPHGGGGGPAAAAAAAAACAAQAVPRAAF